jgi:extracellular elastinolytic metalloproteinase
MRLTLLRRAALAAALGALALPASALGIANVVSGDDGLRDYDSRTGKLAPTRAQKAAAKRLGVRVTWNQFGTPATVSKRGKYLAKGIRAKNAPAAATKWLNRNRALFRIGAAAKLIAGDSPMYQSRGHAVVFHQVFGGLQATEGGTITVAVTGTARKGWKVVFASSNATRDSSLSGTAKLSGVAAWLRAADSVGVDGYSFAHVRNTKVAHGWTQLKIGGLTNLQQVKAVAFPTVRAGVVPAFESIVLKAKEAVGYKVVIDARTGAVLARANLVQNLENKSDKNAAAESYSFSGEVPATEAACATNGPFAIGAGNRALDGFAAATNAANDMVLKLFKDGVELASADTFLSPESFRYSPPGGVPAGNYEIRVCDFDDTGNVPWADPRTYTGTLKGDASAPPPPFTARWKVFPANPPLYTVHGFPWNFPDTDTRETWCWKGATGCDRVIGNLASRGPWDHDQKTNAPTLTTRGNNARSATSWTNANFPSPPQYSPTSAGRDYSFAWTNDWNNRLCEPVPGPTSWDQDASAVNLFVAHNRMHDWAYFLGFTEPNFNAQDFNFGLTERLFENDPIIGDVQAGAQIAGVRDNANMITLPDGQSSVTNMYFWQPFAGSFYAPCVDGDYDMGVIGHEYGHMIENRMIGKGNVRSGHHAGAMGESFGDLNGMEYLNENGFVPTDDENRYAVGTYDTGNKLRAIRNYGMNFPTSGAEPEPGKQLMVDALNFSDMGYDLTGPSATSSQQVHANGEIWSKINFGIRRLLVKKYNKQFPYDDEDLQYACANGELPPYACPGNRRWFALYYDAMLLMPTNPSMLQARDAILAADLARFGGANQKELWLGFARGGMGEGATSTNNSLANAAGVESDTDPTPSFRSPLHDNATIRFRVKGKDGTTIENARVFVGHYEARVSPIADTNPATAGLNLDDVAEFVPGTYELVAQAPGYGFLRGRKTFYRGDESVIEFRMPTNYASMHKGATASGDVWTGELPGTVGTAAVPRTPPSDRNFLIDDTESTNWTAPADIVSGNMSVDGKQVTIDLAGTDPVHIRHIQVSAHLRNFVTPAGGEPLGGQNRFTALRQFEVWACNAKKDDCSAGAGFTKVYTSPADAFPGDPPRPVAPHLILREFDIPNTKATHLRLVAKTSQCTGGPAFQGEQDADPANNTDCDSNVPAPTPPTARTSRAFVRAAEFQAFEHEGSLRSSKHKH